MTDQNAITELVFNNEPERTKPPILSLITLCYNTGKYIIENMCHIKSQLSEQVEHVILDDNSPDNSLQLIIDYVKSEDYPARIYKNQHNCGITESKSRIIRLATGQFISSCSDDIYLPNRISHDLGILRTIPQNCAGVYSLALPFHQDSQGNRKFARNVVGAGIYADKPTEVQPEDFRKKLAKSNFIPAITVCLRKSIYAKIPQDSTFFIEDYPFWARLSLLDWSIMFSPVLTTLYRRMSHSVQKTHAHLVAFDDIRVKMEILQSPLERQNIHIQSLWLRVVCNADAQQVKQLIKFCRLRHQPRGLLLILASIGAPRNLRTIIMKVAFKTHTWQWL